MSADTSVTLLLRMLEDGDREAVRPLWERYYHQLVARARTALGSAPRRMADEEDVALSAFNSFCRGAENGRFPHLDDRDDLWRVLLTITARKASHQVRDEFRLRRGGGQVRVGADLKGSEEDNEEALNLLAGSEPTPELAAQVADEYRRLLDKLGDDDLRTIAVWQMEGYTVEEIATRWGRSERTVARKLVLIRERWSKEGSEL